MDDRYQVDWHNGTGYLRPAGSLPDPHPAADTRPDPAPVSAQTDPTQTVPEELLEQEQEAAIYACLE